MEIINTTIEQVDIENQELFSDVDFKSIIPLLRDCEVYTVDKDELLIKIAEQNNNIYLILSGSFQVFLSKEMIEPVALIKAGQSLGEMTVIDNQPASAYVRAAEESKILKIDEEVAWSLIGSSHAIANNLLIILSQRLRHGNALINKIRVQLKEYQHNATVDALTNLYNRRWLDNMLTRVMHRCDKNDQQLSVMMIDIDNFKNYNDEYGHLAGDIALNTVSKTIVEHLRPEDLITRYGGEEIFTLLPGLSAQSAATIADRLRHVIQETKIIDRDGQALPGVTISIGVAQMQDPDDDKLLLETADKALYKAKENGRNRVYFED